MLSFEVSTSEVPLRLVDLMRVRIVAAVLFILVSSVLELASLNFGDTVIVFAKCLERVISDGSACGSLDVVNAR